MKLPVMSALNLFSIPITVVDHVGARVNFKWSVTALPARVIRGSFQPAREQDIKLAPEGFAVEGAMILHTKNPIYISDLSDATGEEARQSYVQANGQVWRAKTKADWAVYGNFSAYMCEKYNDHDQ